MAEIDNEQPDAPKSKLKPDDSAAHTITVFAQSLAYSALESPARGAAQIVDQTFGTKIDDKVQSKLNDIGIHQPEAAKFGSNAWTAQQFGSAIGMIAPMFLARKTMIGKAERESVKTAVAEETVTAALKQSSFADKALREAKLSARTGFMYGAVLTPTDDKDPSTGNFVLNRFRQGFNSGVIFGGMGASASLSGELLNRTAKSLDSTALPSIFKSPLQTALHSSLVHGSIAGVPGGVIQAQLGAMENGKLFASAQDIKESVVSMTMVGGAMGSASLFKAAPLKPAEIPTTINLDFTTENKKPLVDNLAALRLDLLTHSSSLEPIVERERFLEPEVAKASNAFDINFDPIDKAWHPDEVNKHMSIETRSIEFAPENRASQINQADWNKFYEWGVEERRVPVNVYRFPGLETEIVVPSDYARILDQVRLNRLNPPDTAGANDSRYHNKIYLYEDRILPEEIAQMVKQMPQPDLVRCVELLDHADPLDLKKTYDLQVAAEERGEAIGLRHRFIALADASTDGSGRIRFFDSSTNEPVELQETTAHEWSHLLERNMAYKAFSSAAKSEQHGFFTRDYAKENDHENWAVHLGELFLNADGGAFAELPEKAPARTLVMAKALRNMLDERKDNPTSKHGEFLARTKAAEDLATRRLQEDILADVAKGDEGALREKLRFLNVAATSAQSPELLAKVISPIESQLLPVLQQKGGEHESAANELLVNRLTSQLVDDYSAEKMPEFIDRWKAISSWGTQTRLFKILPEDAQMRLMNNLSEDSSGEIRNLLKHITKETDGRTQQLALNALDKAQDTFEKEGLQFYRSHQQIPEQYIDWLVYSNKPEAKLAALQNDSRPATKLFFDFLIENLPPPALREMIVGDAIGYVGHEYKADVWRTVLNQLPQSEQVQLFAELAQKHDPAYQKLANQIEKMSAIRFSTQATQISDESFEILSRRENSPHFIMSHSERIKDSTSFLRAANSLDSKQLGKFINEGALDRIASWDVENIFARLGQGLDPHRQLEILGAIKPSLDSQARLDALFKLSADNDPTVSAKAKRLLTVCLSLSSLNF